MGTSNGSAGDRRKKRSGSNRRGSGQKNKRIALELKSRELAKKEIKKQCYICEELLERTYYGHSQWITLHPEKRMCSQCMLPPQPEYGQSRGYIVDSVDNEYDWESVYIGGDEDESFGNEAERGLSEQAREWIRKTF